MDAKEFLAKYFSAVNETRTSVWVESKNLKKMVDECLSKGYLISRDTRDAVDFRRLYEITAEGKAFRDS